MRNANIKSVIPDEIILNVEQVEFVASINRRDLIGNPLILSASKGKYC